MCVYECVNVYVHVCECTCESGGEAGRSQRLCPLSPPLPSPSHPDCPVGALTIIQECVLSISQDSPHSNGLPPCPTRPVHFSDPHSLVFRVENAIASLGASFS